MVWRSLTLLHITLILTSSNTFKMNQIRLRPQPYYLTSVPDFTNVFVAKMGASRCRFRILLEGEGRYSSILMVLQWDVYQSYTDVNFECPHTFGHIQPILYFCFWQHTLLSDVWLIHIQSDSCFHFPCFITECEWDQVSRQERPPNPDKGAQALQVPVWEELQNISGSPPPHH